MAVHPLSSTNLAWCEYHSKQKRLVIGFNLDGRVYEYYDVPAWVFQELLDAPSAGQYHRATLYFGYKRNALGQWRHTDKGVDYDEITDNGEDYGDEG